MLAKMKWMRISIKMVEAAKKENTEENKLKMRRTRERKMKRKKETHSS